MKYIQQIEQESKMIYSDNDTVYYCNDNNKVFIQSQRHFTFGTYDLHIKNKQNSVIGDICFFEETPIGIVVYKDEYNTKILSLDELTFSKDKKYVLWNATYPLNMKYGDYSDIDGKVNTIKLIEEGSKYAAILCDDFRTVGTNSHEWYLPAIEELKIIGENFDLIQNGLNSLNNNTSTQLKNEYYWSSTKKSRYDIYATVFNFNTKRTEEQQIINGTAYVRSMLTL